MKRGEFKLEGGYGNDGSASYQRGAQDFSPVGYPSYSREAIGRMDPMGALAAYLGIKKALANSQGPASSPEYREAQRTAGAPIQQLLNQLTGQGTNLSDTPRRKTSFASSGPSNTSAGLFDGVKAEREAREEMEQKEIARQMAKEALKNSRIQNALSAEAMRSENQGRSLKNSARKSLLDSGFITALLRQLNG